jgi:branched-chain amino acid transport system substrate-binding protein
MKRKQAKWDVVLIIISMGFVIISLVGYSAEGASEQPPIKLGNVSTWSSISGLGVKQGFEMAIEDLNKAGGVLGRKVEGVVYDDMGNPDEVKRATERALHRDKVDAIVATHRSDLAIVQQPLVMEAKKIFVIGAPGADLLTRGRIKQDYETYKYTFTMETNAQDMEALFYDSIDTALKLGLKKLAFAAEKAAWFDNIYVAAEKKYADKIVYKTRFPTTASEFRTEWLKVIESGADILWFISSGSAGTPAVLQWYDMKVPALMIGYCNDGNDPKFWELTAGKCDGVQSVGTGLLYGAPMTKKSLPFRKAYKEKFGYDLRTYAIGHTYDAVMVWVEAVKLAGTIDSDAVLKVLERDKFHYVGVNAEIEWFDKIHNPWNSVYWKLHQRPYGGIGWAYSHAQWQNGKLVLIHPEDYKQGNMIIPERVQKLLKK